MTGCGAATMQVRLGQRSRAFPSPGWAHLPLVAFATLATIIASQAIISGAFSLTQQAIQLGFLPRIRVLHTATHEAGQIYMPGVNWLLAAGTFGAVVTFGSSDALGGAYGIAVSMLMMITTIISPGASVNSTLSTFFAR